MSLLLVAPATLTAQEPAPGSLDRARTLRDTGDLAGALQLLQPLVANGSEDVEAARLLAQTLYWTGAFDQARAAYEAAHARHPGHAGLRLEYGRMLAETGDRATARAVLRPLRDVPASKAETETLLGTLAYWDGDWTAARDLFRSALRADPAQRHAARQLREIEMLTAPWLRVSATLWRDDQPIDRLGAGFEAGWFPAPLLSIRLRTEPARHVAAGTTDVWTTEAGISHFAPASGMETDVAGGVLRRADGRTIDWTGRGALGWRLGGGVTARGRLERGVYLNTLASLETPVMTNTVTALVDVKRPSGLLAEGAHQRQSYPDGNIIRTSYGWVLAPLLWKPRARLQAGYAVAFADADEDRFVAEAAPARVRPGRAPISVNGRYAPYYTPQRAISHSITGALMASGARGPLLRLNGSYAFRGAEDATVFVLTGNHVQSSVFRRVLTPWTVRALIEMPVRETVGLEASGEFGRKAFYGWGTAGLHIVYRFMPRARGGDD